MTPEDIRRIEGLTFTGWPALSQIAHDGWLLRFAQGYTGRANSVNPLNRGEEPLDTKIPRCEAAYAEMSQPCLFRTTPVTEPDLVPALEARGYERIKDTLVLSACELDPGNGDDRVSLNQAPHGGWLETHGRAAGLNDEHRIVHGEIVSRIALPCAFALLQVEGEGVCTALIVVDRDHALLFDVATAPGWRGMGFAHRIVRAALGWAHGLGARTAHLQVHTDNSAARALYEGLGFTRESYTYHYWAQGAPGP